MHIDKITIWNATFTGYNYQKFWFLGIKYNIKVRSMRRKSLRNLRIAVGDGDTKMKKNNEKKQCNNRRKTN